MSKRGKGQGMGTEDEAAGPLVDQGAQDDLRSVLGGEDFNRLVRTLSGQIASGLPKLVAAMLAGDGEAARHCAHNLKGAARNLGFLRLPMALAALEQACRDDHSGDWPGRQAAVEQAADATQSWIAAALEGVPAQ